MLQASRPAVRLGTGIQALLLLYQPLQLGRCPSGRTSPQRTFLLKSFYNIGILGHQVTKVLSALMSSGLHRPLKVNSETRSKTRQGPYQLTYRLDYSIDLVQPHGASQ